MLQRIFTLCFLAAILLSARLHASDHVRVIETPNGGSPAHAARAADGTIHLLYETRNEPFYVKSTDNGATFSAPLKVVDEASLKTKGLEYLVWDMALGRNGQVCLALGNNAWKLKLPQDQWGCFFTTLEANAKAFTPLRSINHEPSEGFSIAADGKGNVALFWLKGKVFAALSRDDGKTFGAPAQPDPTCDPCPCCTTSATYGSNGTVACIYREKANDERDMHMLTISSDGRHSRQKVSSTPWKINACPMTYFNVNPIENGYALAWPTKGDIYFARVGTDGKLLPPGEIKTVGKSGMRCGVIARTAPNGDTLVAWNKDGQLGWQIFDAKGSSVEQPGSATSRGKGVAAVVAKDGSFILFR